MKKAFFTLLLLLSTVAFSADPQALVKAKDTELQQLLKKKSRDAKETETVKKLINGIFDFQTMAKKSLPVKTWKKLTPAEQTEFTTVFQSMVENTSIKKLEVYKADSTQYAPTEISGEKAVVTATVWNKGRKAVVVYKMELQSGDWKAWDFVMDDVSTVENYREQYSKYLEKKTFAELIDLLRKKAEENAK